ncbi:histidine kinase [Microlunatus lacustris]
MASPSPPPRPTDVVVAAGCWLVAIGGLLASPVLAAAEGPSSVVVAAPGSFGWWSALVAVTVQAGALLWARSAPRAVLVAVAAVPLLLSVAGSADTFSLTGLAVVVAAFVVGLRVRWRRLRASLGFAATALVVGGSVNGLADGRVDAGLVVLAAVLQVVTVLGAPLLVASALAARREARDAGRRELAAVAREHDALVQAAVAQERTAMARELHDIAAHHLSGIALMAAAIERQIDTDPDTAKRSVRQVREQSTTVLDDLRRLVGLMREEDTDAPRSVASLAAVPELVAQWRADGAPVELRVHAAPGARSLGAGVGTLAQLALYRIAQESLTNAANHAHGAPTVVELDDRDEEVMVLTVTNGPGGRDTSAGGGFGLVGMQERADLLGAELRHGRTAEGGWQVRVKMSRDVSGRSGPPPRPGQEVGP